MHIVQVCKGRCDFASLESKTKEHTMVSTVVRNQISHRQELLFWLREREFEWPHYTTSWTLMYRNKLFQ